MLEQLQHHDNFQPQPEERNTEKSFFRKMSDVFS
jgi:molecular chaperone DnaJ